ncbi:hypothetical protein K438DRAFT_1765526 [Mycena galopus ATCC 62051]|nr:hypothetical protein K438DRAFT_1765526 [Mycena galopus ATCC 62051]
MPTSPLPVGSPHLTDLLSALADVDFRQKDLAAVQWRLKQVALATFGVPVGVATLASASHMPVAETNVPAAASPANSPCHYTSSIGDKRPREAIRGSGREMRWVLELAALTPQHLTPSLVKLPCSSDRVHNPSAHREQPREEYVSTINYGYHGQTMPPRPGNLDNGRNVETGTNDLHTYFPGQGVASPAGANAGVVPSSFLSPGPSVKDAFQVLFSRGCSCFVQSRNSKADLLNSQLALSPFPVINTQNQWRHFSHMRGAVDIPAAGPPTTTPLHSLNHGYTVPAAATATTSISAYTPASMNTTNTRYCERETPKQSSRRSSSGMAKISTKRTTASLPGSLSASIPAISHPPFTEKCTRMAKRMNQSTKVAEIQGTVGYSRSHAGHAPAMGDGYSEADSSAANAGRMPLRKVKPEDWLV